jgi:predicted nucleotidyltransferase component of viral defense system
MLGHDRESVFRSQPVFLIFSDLSRKFEYAAFYGGTAIRVLYGLDRFSEDLDFSLLKSNPKYFPDFYRYSLCVA